MPRFSETGASSAPSGISQLQYFADGRIDAVPAAAALQLKPVELIQALPAIAAAEFCSKIAVTQEDPLLYHGL